MDDRQAISSLIPKIVPSDLEGRDAVTEMKDTGGQWKQMEWAGFWFEHRFLATAPAEIGGGEGPRFDRVAFDYERDCWLVRHGFPGVDALGELAGLRYGLAGDAPQTEAQAQFVKAWEATDRMMER